MQNLLYFDQQLFLFINHLPHAMLLDQIALFLSAVGKWGLVWLVIAFYLFFREEKRDPWFFAPVLFAATTSMIVVETVIKPIVSRLRPGLEFGAILVGRGPGGFSFPSTHATLAFAFAYILSHEESKLKYWLYALAVLISLSRIYLGAHYPLDIIGGALLGWGIGKAALGIIRK